MSTCHAIPIMHCTAGSTCLYRQWIGSVDLAYVNVFGVSAPLEEGQNGGEEAGEGRSYQEMFSPVLSHLAAEATSYYAWALAVTIIIITRRLELKNRSAHLADELPNDLLEKIGNGTWPTNVSALSPSLLPPSPLLSHASLSVSLTPSVAHSLSSFLSVTFEKW